VGKRQKNKRKQRKNGTKKKQKTGQKQTKVKSKHDRGVVGRGIVRSYEPVLDLDYTGVGVWPCGRGHPCSRIVSHTF
jgi:hypothetical protein